MITMTSLFISTALRRRAVLILAGVMLATTGAFASTPNG
jgi:hypothetical protein